MTWNYRIIRHETDNSLTRFKKLGKKKPKKEYWYGLHEVFYNEKDEPYTYATTPDAVGETIEELCSSIGMMLKDAKAGQKAIKRNKKNLFTAEDFEKEGRFYISLVEFERETEEDIKNSIPFSLPTTNERNPKNNRRKPRPRDGSTGK